jgi:threonine aldolase
VAHFASDNWAGAHPKIAQAIADAAHDFMPAYGGDDLTKAVEAQFAEIFETDVAVAFVATGIAANCLGLSVYTPPYGAIFCHEYAHIAVEEYNGQSLFTGGAQMIVMPGERNKIDAEKLQSFLANIGHQAIKPTTLSITQQTELGAVYARAEIQALSAIAKHSGMKTHMDGARFSNALMHLGCTPAEMTWKNGIDVLSFGGTKNGCVFADAVVVFNPTPAVREELRIRQSRSGHTFSKMRFVAAQFQAYFKDGLWLDLARHANAMAQQLSERLTQLGYAPKYPVQGNQLFVPFPSALAEKLTARGHTFYPWHDGTYRLVTSYLTSEDDVNRFCQDVAGKN